MSELKSSRKQVKNRLGADVESKATDAFCIAFGAVSPSGAMLEDASIEERPRATILEIADRGRRKKLAAAAPASVSFDRALALKLGKSFPLEVSRILRKARIDRAKEEFFQTAAPVQGHLESTAGGMTEAMAEDADPTFRPMPSTQACWINRSIRTFAAGSALSEIAAHEAVSLIDIPKNLELELDLSAATVNVDAFRNTTGLDGKGVIVAVIDKEVDKDHPGLRGRVFQKRNYTREAWGAPQRHGTAVAGIIGSSLATLRGMAPAVTIYGYKVFSATASADDFYGARALQDALEDLADIANCSWGAGRATDGTSREARACDTVWNLGMTVVKSAGNSGPGKRTLTTPADAKGVIVVGATDRRGTTIGSYSSRGPAGARKRPHLVAPGGSLAEGLKGLLPGGGVGGVGYGTSYAAPHVTGIAALFLQKNRLQAPDDLRAALLAKCTPIPGFGVDDQGAGLIRL